MKLLRWGIHVFFIPLVSLQLVFSPLQVVKAEEANPPASSPENCDSKTDTQERKECLDRLHAEISEDYEKDVEKFHYGGASLSLANMLMSWIYLFISHHLSKKYSDACPSVAMKILFSGGLVGFIGEVVSFAILKIGDKVISEQVKNTNNQADFYQALIREFDFVTAAESVKVGAIAINLSLTLAALVVAVVKEWMVTCTPDPTDATDEVVDGLDGLDGVKKGEGLDWQNLLLTRAWAEEAPANPGPLAPMGGPAIMEVMSFAGELVVTILEGKHLFHHGAAEEAKTLTKNKYNPIGRIVFISVKIVVDTIVLGLAAAALAKTIQNRAEVVEMKNRLEEEGQGEGQGEGPGGGGPPEGTFLRHLVQPVWAQAGGPQNADPTVFCVTAKGKWDQACQCRKNNSCFQLPTQWIDKNLPLDQQETQKLISLTNNLMSGKESLGQLNPDTLTARQQKLTQSLEKYRPQMNAFLAKNKNPPLSSFSQAYQKVRALVKELVPDDMTTFQKLFPPRQGLAALHPDKVPSFVKKLPPLAMHPAQVSVPVAVSAPAEKPGEEKINPQEDMRNFSYRGASVHLNESGDIWKILSARYEAVFEEEIIKADMGK